MDMISAPATWLSILAYEAQIEVGSPETAWVAICLDINYAVSGDSLAQVRDRMKAGLSLTLQRAIRSGAATWQQLFSHPAPPAEWARFREIESADDVAGEHLAVPVVDNQARPRDFLALLIPDFPVTLNVGYEFAVAPQAH